MSTRLFRSPYRGKRGFLRHGRSPHHNFPLATPPTKYQPAKYHPRLVTWGLGIRTATLEKSWKPSKSRCPLNKTNRNMLLLRQKTGKVLSVYAVQLVLLRRIPAGGERKSDMATKCRHCGSTSYGHGCAYGSNRIHEHRDDEKHCEWCGSSSYGHGCAYGPDRLHRHGPGGNKCIWCGSTSNGSGCPYSPTHRHEK